MSVEGSPRVDGSSPSTGRVLVVDDEVDARDMLAEALVEAGFDVVAVEDGETGLQRALGSSFDVCLSDVRMPGLDGLELLRRLGEASPETRVILVTGYGDMETAVEALRAGASDFVTKPVLLDDVCNKVQHLVGCRRLGQEVRTLTIQIDHAERAARHTLIGDSLPMFRVRELIARVADTASTVLITGEVGTGKELVAKAVHMASKRIFSSFVPFDCGSMPEVGPGACPRGASMCVTAFQERLLAAARGGTLFLDEVAELPLDLQGQLLRVLESGEIHLAGSERRMPFEARVLAATRRDLAAEVEAGRFREDLYYQLAVFEIRCPPLREHLEDLPALALHMVQRFNVGLSVRFAGLSGPAMRALMECPWKGNVRELGNVIERAMILADPPVIEVEHLPRCCRAESEAAEGPGLSLKDAVHHFETLHIRSVIDRCGGDKRRASRLLGIGLSSLYRKLDGLSEGDAGGRKAAGSGSIGRGRG